MKRKTKEPLGILRKSIETTNHNNNGRALGINQSALELCFDKCEEDRSRFTVIFFFFPLKTVHTSNLNDSDTVCALNRLK